MAYVILILAVLSRILPHALHLTGANVTLVGAGLLFFGSRLKPRQRWQVLPALVALAASDWYLTTVAYGYPFHAMSYLPTWLWYGAVCLGASAWLGRNSVTARTGVTALRVGAAAVASSTGFFLMSNGLVWAKSSLYAHTAAGLGQCYIAGLPFYRNEMASTLVFSAVFFALPWAAASLTQTARSLAGDGVTAA